MFIESSNNKPMEILLVEDGLLDARITIHALRRSGVRHRLTLVRTAAEATAFLECEGVFARAPKPDLLLLDLTLPDGDGISILQAMRDKKGDHLPPPPVVVLSASDDAETQARCAAMGVDDFIGKPVNEDKFLEVVRTHENLTKFSEREVMSV
ncbi:Response regulator rcp1 [Roseimaritima multifibrata]|uniref:Response regulator rcp1 n=1 Tax=Roseimaritima multifibrata TaxID=1930274 RepID=A0A517MD16_9BACT|nr:response regulator [Roseimaritima multifibrata]QDS92784.1 Response regulator rcp1 [Roseimaritima multifibrata]